MSDRPSSTADGEVGDSARAVFREIGSTAVAIMVAAVVMALVPLRSPAVLHDASVVVAFAPAAACFVLLRVFRRPLRDGGPPAGRRVRRWCNLLLAVALTAGGLLLVLGLALG